MRGLDRSQQGYCPSALGAVPPKDNARRKGIKVADLGPCEAKAALDGQNLRLSPLPAPLEPLAVEGDLGLCGRAWPR